MTPRGAASLRFRRALTSLETSDSEYTPPLSLGRRVPRLRSKLVGWGGTTESLENTALRMCALRLTHIVRVKE